MPLLALLALFIVVPLAELYVILKVGDAIGAVWTIALLAADSLLGALLLRTQGRSVWRRFNEALAAGRMPHREVVDGVLVVFGGAFLITPGFLTDIVGLLLLLPPTRSVIAGWSRDAWAGAWRSGSPAAKPAAAPYDVDGTATEYEAPPGGSSGEPRGVRALLLRRRPPALRNGAVGRDAAVPRAPADRSPRGPAGRPRG